MIPSSSPPPSTYTLPPPTQSFFISLFFHSQVPLDCFSFLTRIHYKARSCETWGEHEIDYILIAQRDVDLSPNPNEVMNCHYMDQKEVQELLKKGERGEMRLSPWFKMISEKFLIKWWDHLSDLSAVVDPETIHRCDSVG